MNNNMEVKKTVRRELTYLGSRAIVVTDHYDSSREGLRRVTMTWIDAATPENGGWPAGTTTTRVIKGNGWRENARIPFQVIEAEHVVEVA